MSRSTLITYAALWICTAMLVSSARAVDGTIVYDDYFIAGLSNAETVSCAHSRFWSQDMTPLPGSYLFYVAPGFYNNDYPVEGLVFIEDENQRAAELCYAFSLPSCPAQQPVTAQIDVCAEFPEYPTSTDYIPRNAQGSLSLYVGPNGTTWTMGKSLADGTVSLPPVDCPENMCYIRLVGKRAVLKWLRVTLSPRSTTKSVPSGYKTIQAAIDAASDGDVIEVAKGTYSGAGNRDIDFKGKKITVRSEAGPQSTILDCSSGGRGFYFHKSESTAATLSGFTIRNGKITSGSGGGIYCESGSSPTIINCVITGCDADSGGGIAVKDASPRIIDCVITRCTATNGGGIYGDCNSQNSVTVGGCSITDNAARATGGGVYCSNATFQNCLIATNSAGTASGLYAAKSSSIVTMKNCTIAGNSGSGGVLFTSPDVRLTNCIVWGNGGTQISSAGSVTYSDVQGGYSGDGNINGDPAFTSDYGLSSTSPCIDKGDPSILPATEPYPNGGYSDMGAYGASPQAPKGTSHAIYHVAGTGGMDANYDGRGLSKDYPFATIKYAVSRAQNGDTILLWGGPYVLGRSSEVFLNGKAIRIQSAADPVIISAPKGYAFTFQNNETSATVLSNLIITGCGEAAICCFGASPTLKNLTIVGNSCGVLAESNAKPTIVNCIFWANGNKADVSQDSTGGCNLSYCLWNGNTLINNKVVPDPCFADMANGDYHLKSPYGRYVSLSGTWVYTDTGYSPCIDAGEPFYPRAELCPNGSIVDMGAHGGTRYASRSKN
jgi:hypothetical protein